MKTSLQTHYILFKAKLPYHCGPPFDKLTKCLKDCSFFYHLHVNGHSIIRILIDTLGKWLLRAILGAKQQ